MNNIPKYLNKPYIINNIGELSKLQIGDYCIVHPVIERSQSQYKFRVKIIAKEINWVPNPCFELCTKKRFGHSAVINDYLFFRLEKSKRRWYEYFW